MLYVCSCQSTHSSHIPSSAKSKPIRQGLSQPKQQKIYAEGKYKTNCTKRKVAVNPSNLTRRFLWILGKAFHRTGINRPENLCTKNVISPYNSYFDELKMKEKYLYMPRLWVILAKARSFVYPNNVGQPFNFQ